jgi:hypothetical protein
MQLLARSVRLAARRLRRLAEVTGFWLPRMHGPGNLSASAKGVLVV